jgi:DNA-binding XRE family transcriptional regulator
MTADPSSSKFPTPFADAALGLAAHGLAVIPLGGDDGKKPLVAWEKMRRRPGRAFLERLAARHGTANIGILTGLSGIVVIDVDESGLINDAIRRFGETPLIVSTPRGGAHLYYRGSGERCGTLRTTEGSPIDWKGIGGVVSAPPSIRPTGPHAGAAYTFRTGSWKDLTRLPVLRPGSLPGVDRRRDLPMEGNRNDALFRFLLRGARGCDSMDQLKDVAAWYNELLQSPLSEAEITRTVASAWRYESDGSNWVGTEARATVTWSAFKVLARNPDALALLLSLNFSHALRREPFAVVAKAMHEANHIPGWGLQKYRASKEFLIAEGFLKVTHRGGKKPGDAWLYQLKDPAFVKGSETEPKTAISSDIDQRSLPRHSTQRRKTRYTDQAVDLVTLAGGEAAPRRTDPKIFGARLRAARKASGMTQAELAAQVGITRAALSNVELANYPAGSDLQRRCSKIFMEIAA